MDSMKILEVVKIGTHECVVCVCLLVQMCSEDCW